MKVIDHAKQPLDTWRDGVMTRMRVSATVGARQLCIFEQYCDPGLGAPVHLHAVEEVLEIIAGTAEITVRDATVTVGADQSVLIPAGARHSFRNVGRDILHVRATLAAPIFEASYADRDEIARRYVPDGA
ncbi:cupin domain-containing protein [Phreatobacter sp. AB_2022a]|uniref:cupin domain-containing protein n=1 Tax=Phreatobacter sp. AB_2022a TaxID=3003134 RepID=UPI002287000F|nr:cupin domain-containing protein [Phreatobacter sp. AB_2022a]MCZ0736330.1 cupin domain-containing protein [Phreatobacter sp. AB_2022a]